jgi:nicotinate dehydrogenase subunit B
MKMSNSDIDFKDQGLEKEDSVFDMNRRKFFKIFGSGLAITFVLSDAFGITEEILEEGILDKVPTEKVGAWLHIGEDNIITVYTGKVEVGQNIRTSLAQLVAEELQVPIASIKMVMGDTDLTPYDAGTFGSRTTPYMGPQLRKAAATAREALVDMAAKAWKRDLWSISMENGKLVDQQTKKTLTYGQLTKGKQLLIDISNDVELSSPQQWTVAGKSIPKVNGRDIVSGKHEFVSDLKLPGMVYAKVLRPPSYGSTLKSLDDKAASSMNGVKVVREGDFVAVVAVSLNVANKALASLKAEWNIKGNQPSRDEIFKFFKDNAGEAGKGRGNNDVGNMEKGRREADHSVSASFNIEYIAHVPMEPRAALAEFKDGKLTVWTGTQRPFGVQEELSNKFKMPKEKIRVIMPDTGSAYGGKHSGEAALEAAQIALAVNRPVKLVWTREEEFKWAYFRPGGLIEVNAGVKKNGTISFWEFQNYNSGSSGIRMPYEALNQKVQFIPVESPIRQGSYRGLASTANIFAIESIMDDLAYSINMDPLEFRLKNLQDPRLKAVFEAAAKSFGWGKNKPAEGIGYGIGGGTEKGGYVACCAEVSVNSSGEVKVIRLVNAFECGTVVNPDHLEDQVLGSIVQGLGGALFEAVDFKNGRILNPKFAQYRVPRFKDMPKIEMIQINRTDLPSAGAGETPIVGVAPAIRNAIANATGIRLKKLPLVPDGMPISMR